LIGTYLKVILITKPNYYIKIIYIIAMKFIKLFSLIAIVIQEILSRKKKLNPHDGLQLSIKNTRISELEGYNSIALFFFEKRNLFKTIFISNSKSTKDFEIQFPIHQIELEYTFTWIIRNVVLTVPDKENVYLDNTYTIEINEGNHNPELIKYKLDMFKRLILVKKIESLGFLLLKIGYQDKKLFQDDVIRYLTNKHQRWLLKESNYECTEHVKSVLENDLSLLKTKLEELHYRLNIDMKKGVYKR
jgi:hypothetical protein